MVHGLNIKSWQTNSVNATGAKHMKWSVLLRPFLFLFSLLVFILPAMALVISIVSWVDSQPEPARTSWPAPAYKTVEDSILRRDQRRKCHLLLNDPDHINPLLGAEIGKLPIAAVHQVPTQRLLPPPANLLSHIWSGILNAFWTLPFTTITHLARFPLSLSQAMLSSGLNGVTMGGKMPVRSTWSPSLSWLSTQLWSWYSLKRHDGHQESWLSTLCGLLEESDADEEWLGPFWSI